MKNVLFLTVVGCCLTLNFSSNAAAQQIRRTLVSPRVTTFRPVLQPVRRTANAPANWYPYVIARGEDRALIRQMPMEYRPNRPLHFWGNTRRRFQ